MKNSKLKERLRKDRPMTMISLRVPEDVVEDLKLVAPKLGFSGYQLKPVAGDQIFPAVDRHESDQLQEGFESERTRNDRVLIKMSLKEPFVGFHLFCSANKAETFRAAVRYI